MWIMLIKKLPTKVTPPRGSIHWAGANASVPEREIIQKIQEKQARLVDIGDKFVDDFANYEPKEAGSVWIIFDSQPLKVFPHEYIELDKNTMKKVILGLDDDYNMSHLPMYGRTALFADPLTLTPKPQFDEYPRFSKDLYEAAMIDGQLDLHAFYTAIGGYQLDLWFAMGIHYASSYGYTLEELTPNYDENSVLENIKSGWKGES